MADVPVSHKTVTKFLFDTCVVGHTLPNLDAANALLMCAELANIRVSSDNGTTGAIPLITGSVAEFHIQPMLSCVGDVDMMVHRSDELAIPAGTSPPALLPGEFHSRVKVYEIIDSEFPGYVYLVLSYILTECIDDDTFKAVQCLRQYKIHDVDHERHGPAIAHSWRHTVSPFVVRLCGERFSTDRVLCVRCLSWPSQAADWPTRHRNYGCPDSATVDRVVSNGCDVVGVAHRHWRQHKWISESQWRMSFSRAEIVLLNSWMLVQQIVYHVLRVFVKTERLTESANNPEVITLSNFHIKTLMLWACELKPRSWWIDDLNVVRLSVKLLHTLAVWLTDARCQHYFIHNCNLFDHPDNCNSEISSRLISVTEESMSKWFIDSYIRKCSLICGDNVARLFYDVNDATKLHKALSAVIDWRRSNSLMTTAFDLIFVQFLIVMTISNDSLSVPSCLCLMRDVGELGQSLYPFFTAVTLLHVALKTTKVPLTDELLDVLATTCLQSNDVRRCMNARRSSGLSLSQAAKLMKVVANNSRSTMQLIEIELSKAYLYRALRCKDSDSDSIYCLANVYLAVLYYTTGHYQTVIDHCTLVTRSQDHSQCSSHVVQGELLPKIDDDIDNVLGLAVFYQYVRTAALNQQQQTQHVSVFTTELFAHYLHIRCQSVMTYRQLTQTSSTDEIQRYRKCFHEWQKTFITDVLLASFVDGTKYPADDQRQMVVSSRTTPKISDQLDTSELVQLLQQSAVEHLTACRQLEAQESKSFGLYGTVTADFVAVYAYRCGEYQRCLQLSTHNVRTLISDEGVSYMHAIAYPEFIQLLDDELVSLIALMLIVNPSCIKDSRHFLIQQLHLSLYLMTQSQMKLHHSVTSLAQTLDYVTVARRRTPFTREQLVLKLIESKILMYIIMKTL